MVLSCSASCLRAERVDDEMGDELEVDDGNDTLGSWRPLSADRLTRFGGTFAKLPTGVSVDISVTSIGAELDRDCMAARADARSVAADGDILNDT